MNPKLKEKVFELLKKYLVELLLKKLFGRMIGGAWGFLASLLIDYGIKKAVIPSYNYVSRKVKKIWNRFKFKKKIGDLEDANTEDEFDSSVDNLP